MGAESGRWDGPGVETGTMQAMSPECSREAGQTAQVEAEVLGTGLPGLALPPLLREWTRDRSMGQLQRLDPGGADISTSSPERAGATGWISLSDSLSGERAPQAQATH